MTAQSTISRPLAAFVVAVAALVVGVAGNGSQLPLDDHEVLVARTSEEMLARGSIVVPYFNDEPRLTKPPLAYWLTMLVDVAHDGDGVISEWEARVPSILAGVVFALATLSLATTLFGPSIGFIAALLLVSTSGFLTYTHSARPEILYAALCTGGLACFAKSWIGCDDQALDAPELAKIHRRPFWAWLGWAIMGLAVLSKGPQLPLIMLGAWAISMWIIGRRREILRTLRPFSGLIIIAGVSLWWFIIMWNSVPGSGDRMERETLGRIFQTEGKPLSRIVDPYYFYRIVGMLLPWVIPYLLTLAMPLIREIKMSRAARLLWWVSVLTLVVMHVSLNRRWYYLLPLTSVVATLMAFGSASIGQHLLQAGRVRIWRFIVCAHVVICMVAGAYMWFNNPQALKPPIIGIGALLVVCLGAGAFLATRSARSLTAIGSLATVVLVTATLWVVSSVRSSPWSMERFARREFGLHIGTLMTANGPPLVGWHNDWQHEQYYLHRAIPSFEKKPELLDALRDRKDSFLLSNSRKPLDLPENVRLTEAYRIEVEPGEELTLWRVRAE